MDESRVYGRVNSNGGSVLSRVLHVTEPPRLGNCCPGLLADVRHYRRTTWRIFGKPRKMETLLYHNSKWVCIDGFLATAHLANV